MNKLLQPMIGRRDMLRALAVGAVAASAVSAPLSPAQAAAKGKSSNDKARYQANSPDVQNYYRVNRYPTQCGRRPC